MMLRFLGYVFFVLQIPSVFADVPIPEGLDERPPELKPYSRWDKSVKLKINTGMMQHSYADRFTDKTSVSYPWLGLSLGFGVGNFAIIGNYAKSDASSPQNTLAGISTFTATTFSKDDDYDVSLSWTYNVNKKNAINVFGGYKWSSTLLERTNFVLIDGAQKKISFTPIQIKTEGPFVGLGYSYKLFETAETRIGFNVAYSPGFQGKLVSAPNINEKNPPPPPGDTTAIRYGIFVTSPFSGKNYENFFYSIGLDGYSYELEDPTPNDSSDTSSFLDESIWTVTFSIGYKFDL